MPNRQGESVRAANRQRTARRTAFSLVELLVVIAIIGVLVGLLLAAVQNVRSAASRADCQNRIKQLALALHHHDQVRGTLPPGHRSALSGDPRPYTGWTLDILPYLEQDALSAEIEIAFRRSRFPFSNPPHVRISTVVNAYTCPADPRVTTPQVSLQTQTLVAFTSYLGVSGTDYRTKDGVFVQDYRCSLLAITDGTSNTLLLGERPPSSDFQFGWWYAGTGQALTGSGDLILGVREQNIQPIVSGSRCGPGAYPFRASRFDDPCGLFHFWSPHSGGANFAFADGSVHFMRYDVNPLMPALATRSGGEVVEMP